MPIKPENRALYPVDWLQIRARILRRARDACEGTPQFPDCRAANKLPHPGTGSRVVLTIAHIDHDPTNNNPANLRALCQRCHLSWDKDHHMRNAAITRAKKRRQALAEQGQKELF